MRKKLVFALLVSSIMVFPSCIWGQPANALNRKEKKQGWRLLFNGEDLSGWHVYLKPGAKPAWSVDSGAIMTDFNNGGTKQDLVTDSEFENYELSMQWKIEEAGNSGIIFNVHEDPQFPFTFLTGPEMQVLDNIKASDNKKDNHMAGSLYDLIAADPKPVHPAGEWNTIKIRVQDGHLSFWMNGVLVVDTQMWNDSWKQQVANSKFKNLPAFGTFKKGHIALQYHGGEVSYRDIKIREL